MTRSRRLRYLLALLLVIGLGLTSRSIAVGWFVWDKSLGDALYAVAVYLGFRVLAPRLAPRWPALAAVVSCLGIELFKFTGLPAAWASWWWSRLVFGTTPSWHNVVCYGVGIVAVAGVDAAVCRSTSGLAATHARRPRPL
jgi:hypothetical protein